MPLHHSFPLDINQRTQLSSRPTFTMHHIARTLAGIHRDPELPLTRDIPTALTLLQRCIDEQASVAAMYDLAQLLTTSRHTAHDLHRGVHLYETCIAESNHPDAIFKLATILSNRHYGFQNFPRAVRLYQTCIDLCSHTAAMYDLARILVVGAKGVARDVPRAVALYQRCVDAGDDGNAVFELAKLFVAGTYGIERDVARGVRLFERFLDSGNPMERVVYLAKDIARGRSGMLRDASLAHKLFQICIRRRDDPVVVISLAEILAVGAPGVDSDPDRVMRLCESIVDDSFAAVTNLAKQLCKPTSHKACNIPLAARLYDMCILKRNDVDVMISLARLLAAGAPGMQRDNWRAVQLCHKVIDTDPYCDRVVHLAEKIGARKCANRNVTLAVQLCEICIQRKDDPEAMVALARILVSDTHELRIDVERAIGLCEKCVVNYNSSAKVVLLARDLANGKSGVKRNTHLAARLCKLCITVTRCTDAMLMLAKILIADKPDAADVASVMQLCSRIIEKTGDCAEVVNLAREVLNDSLADEETCNIAIQLCEMCISERADAGAMITLARILVTGESQVTNCDRGMRLCARYVSRVSSCNDVVLLAKEMSKGVVGIAPNLPFAIELFELCISLKQDKEAMISLAEILVSRIAGAETDVERALRLCQSFLNGSADCDKVANLARDVARGTVCIEKNVPLAVQLCEMCIDSRSDADAMVCLAEILVSEAGVDNKDDRVVQLCSDFLNENTYCYKVVNLAKDVASGAGGIRRNASLSIRLLELCIEKRNNANAMVYLAEMLLRHVDDGAKLAIALCKKCLDGEKECFMVGELAKKIAHGTSEVVKNRALALQMCEMYMASVHNGDAMLVLAEVMMCATAVSEPDVNRVVELCESCVEDSFYCEKVVELACKIGSGTAGMGRNVRVAMRLFEFCVIRGNNHKAMYCLAEILRVGAADVPADSARATELFQRASDGGFDGVDRDFRREKISYL